MPKYKEDETEFLLSINWGGTQYRTTIPKILIERIKKTQKKAHGTFILNEKILKLTVAKEE